MMTEHTPNGPADGDAAALATYLTAHPGKTVRDFKGKDWVAFDKFYVGPREVPFDQLDRDHVRLSADGVPARLLPRNIRQAAGRDKGMRWDEATRSYRLATAGKVGNGCASPMQYLDSSDPRASAPATAPAGLDSGLGVGGIETLAPSQLTTGATQ